MTKNMDMSIKSINDLPVTLRVVDLIPLLGVCRNTAYALVRSGQIRSVKVGRGYRVPREAIIEFLSGSAA